MTYTDLNIKFSVDDTEVKIKDDNWKGRIRTLNDELSKTEQHLIIVTRKVFSAIQTTISAARSVLHALGIALPPAFEAILAAIASTFWSLQAIAAAYTAGGVTAYLAIPLETAAITLSWFGAALAISGQQEASRKLSDSEQAMRAIGTAATSWGRLINEWGE